MIVKTDLETVDPNGRLDVLTYRGVQKLAEHIESRYGLSGVWAAVKPHVNSVVVEHVSGMEIPTEAKILLSILQANYNKKVE